MAIITPFDNKIGIWFHKGQTVAEATIDQFAQRLRRYAPAVQQVFVKTSDASDWMAKFDNKAAMAIDGPAAISRWVTTLQKYGLEFHAWCVPRGLNIEAEANVILQACKVPGVRSMILDVEPYQNFFTGGKQAVRPLMTRIRSQLPGAFHIAMAVDPRSTQYNAIFPDEWYPFVNSVLLQLYWGTFGVRPDAAISNGYSTWSKFNRPIFPILQSYKVDSADVAMARDLGVNTYKSSGVSYWVYHTMSNTDLATINRSLDGSTPTTPPGTDGSVPSYGPAVTVGVGNNGYSDGSFPDVAPALAAFQTYASASGGTGKYHATDDGVANVWARWDPQIRQSGWYTVEAFIPTQHATTGKARYKIHGIKGQGDEMIVTLPQHYYHNEWAMLGTFQIEANRDQAGVIYLNDWTFEPGLEIAFDAIRWRPVIATGSSSGVGGYISNITTHAREIFLKGRSLGMRANVFSKVGDSMTAAAEFLTPIGQGHFDLGPYRDELLPVVQYYAQADARAGNSFANQPIAAGPGWKAETMFFPLWRDPCGSEQILTCEYSRVKPAVALIMLGTNDSADVDPNFYTDNMKRILDITINTGILPIISTIPPKKLNADANARVDQWNAIIRSLSQQYQIPLWDYWQSMLPAPNQGISADGVHPSVPPDGQTCNFNAAYMGYGFNIRNLGALRALNAVWRQVIS